MPIIREMNVIAPPKKGFNTYRIEGEYVYILLNSKINPPMETKIDLKNLEKVRGDNIAWYSKYYPNNDSFYAMATVYKRLDNGKRKCITLQMHRVVMGYFEENDVDHHNHDTLDNTEENLFIVEKNKNSANRKGANKNSGTGVRNVNYGSERKEYWVQFCKKGERFKWVFPLSQFKEACDFAEIKRKEIFGDYQ